MKNKSLKIMTIAAHPDDEILGCAGTIAKLVKQGHQAYTLILGEGVTARDDIRCVGNRASQLKELKKQALKANRLIGVKEVFAFNFPDNRFDTVAHLDIIKAIEGVLAKIKPDIVFTHYENDLNIDHRSTYNATITATRPIKGMPVKKIYSFETISSTSWKYPLGFAPNVFFAITKTLKCKLKAMKEYRTEIREFPHPRSLEGIELNAQYWGVNIGVPFAEAFKLVRSIE